MKAKKLTLNETWRLCLKMWRWIAEQKRADIASLKSEWLNNNWTGKDIKNDCFFCEYTAPHGGAEDCYECPGRKVDSEFNCCEDDYYYKRKPIKFYNKLVSLNRKRLKAKAKSKK